MRTLTYLSATAILPFIINSCSDDNSGTARAVYPSMKSLSGLEDETAITSLSTFELQALKASAGGLIGIGLFDALKEEGGQVNERPCSISGRFFLLSREESPDQERKRFARMISTQIEQCRYNADTVNNNSYDSIEITMDGSLSSATTFLGTSQAKPDLKADSVQISQANSGNLNVIDVGTNTTTNIRFSNLVYAAHVTSSTQDEYNQISADPLGADEQAARKLEFWKKLMKCSGSVEVNGKTFSCTKVAVTMFPLMFQ